LVVLPPGGSWGKGNHVAVAVLGGDRGVRSPGDRPVVGSAAWALVRGTAPLVDCLDLMSPDCHVLVTLVPLNLARAWGLETLRRGLAPVLDQLEALGVPRSDVAVAWTFRITSLPEATFDPGASIIPFPNDLLRTLPPNAHLNLPVPDGGSA